MLFEQKTVKIAYNFKLFKSEIFGISHPLSLEKLVKSFQSPK